MDWFKKWAEHGLRHLTLSFIFAVLGVDAMISAAATWIAHNMWDSLGTVKLPMHYYILLGILVFCAVTLFALMLVLLNLSVRSPFSGQSLPSAPPPPAAEVPAIPTPVLELPKAVDLRGRLQEIYFSRFDDLLGITTTYVLVSAHVVNHGRDEVTISECGLYASIGSFRAEGKVLQDIPETWRIKRKREFSFIPPTAFDQQEITPILNNHDVYKKGIPHEGWLAFEFTLIGNEMEFPNAQIDLLLRDSLSNSHTITRVAGVYAKPGELIRIPAPTALPPTISTP